MQISLFAIAAVLISATSLNAQSGLDSAHTESIRKEIEANEQTIGRAIHAHDYSVVEKIWSPLMVVNSPGNKVSTRDAVIASMKSGTGLNYSSLKGTVETFQVFDDIAIEMGHQDFVMATGPAAGRPLQRRFTNVWQRNGDRWMQIARQATMLNTDAAWVYGSPSSSSQIQPH